MRYEGNIIRPPSEADSIILQVSVGCSHNKCTFCGTYKDVPFRLKHPHVVEADLDYASHHCHRANSIFLTDGDVLVLPFETLAGLLEKIRSKLPWVRRIRLYGNARAIKGKTLAELSSLKALGLDRIYLGVESGFSPVLQSIRKGADPRTFIECAEKVLAADIFLSVTVLLGIGGTLHSLAHAEATGELLSAMKPSQVGVLTLMLLPNTPLHADAVEGLFTLPSPSRLLLELRTMIEYTTLHRSQFMANHASNFLSLQGRLDRDKKKFLARIDEALDGRRKLRPEALRGL